MCLPQNEIDSALQKLAMFFEYYISSSSIDHYNHDQPLQDTFHTRKIKITYDFVYSYYEIFKLTKYTSDNGRVFEDKNITKGSEYNDSNSYILINLKESSNLGIEGAFTLIHINLNEKAQDNYTRTYPKLQSLVANIGGVIKAITFVCSFFIELISPGIMSLDIANNFIKFPDKTQQSINPNPSASIFKHSSNQLNYIPGVKGQANKKRLGILRAIVPASLTEPGSSKQLAVQCEEYVSKKLSMEYIIEMLNQVEQIKQVMLDTNQLKLFNNVPFLTLNKQTNLMESRKKRLNENEIESLFRLIDNEDKTNKRIIGLYR
jgi:hypothetical protein